MKNKLLITGALLFPLAIAKAQDTTETFQFNLQECIDYAFEHHYQVRNAEVAVELAESAVKETIGLDLPPDNGHVNFHKYLKLTTTLFHGDSFCREKVHYSLVTIDTQL